MGVTLIVAAVAFAFLAFLTISSAGLALASPYPQRRLAIFIIVLVLGLFFGGWFGFAFEYHASGTLRVVGFPLPVVLFQRQDGEWFDFLPPVPPLNGIANLAVIASLFLAPLNLAFRFPRRRTQESQPREKR